MSAITIIALSITGFLMLGWLEATLWVGVVRALRSRRRPVSARVPDTFPVEWADAFLVPRAFRRTPSSLR